MSTRNEQSGHATPVKCGDCALPMDFPLVCASCRRLFPADGLNFFELFGMPARYDLDVADLRKRYFRLSREIHPDRGPAESEGDASRERVSSVVNRAFQVLIDPLTRAEYLLELHGGRSSAEDRTVPPDALEGSLQIREEWEEARQAGDGAAQTAIRTRVDEGFERRMADVAELARSLPGDETLRDLMRARLNAIKYDQRMLEQLAGGGE